jgi:hypothetical protein
MITRKRCKVCDRVLPAAEFYRHPSNADGLFSSCKACHKEAVRRRKEADPAKRAAYEAARSRDPVRKAHNASYLKRARALHPLHHRARAAVAQALRTGKLAKGPCEVCGNPRVQAHHDSYEPEFWLCVRWLCFRHHRETAHGHQIVGEKS